MHKELWLSVLDRLKPTIKKAHFYTWFHSSAIVAKEENKITIGFPNSFARDWVASKYAVKVMQAVKEIDSQIVDVDFEVEGALSEADNADAVNLKKMMKEEGKKVRKVRKQNEIKVSSGNFSGHISSRILNEKYSLNNYVVGGENQLAHAASVAVSNAPGGIYNPLYIYGDVGLGKTHLTQAIGNEILKNFPDKIVKYVTAERFVSEVIDAIAKRKMKQFKDKYRNVDCLLIDDVQFFARKNSSQQEFFHTFNELYESNKQIVITSDRPPSELDDLEDRLTSRFAMGMVVELTTPDLETRMAILNEKAREHAVLITPDVMEFVATNVNSNVRELEGVLKQLVAETQLSKESPSIKSAARIIKRLNRAQEIIGFEGDLSLKQKKVFKNIDDFQKIVASYFDLEVKDLVGKTRKREIAQPRQLCMYLIKTILGSSYEKIGEEFGGRNHTTVLHSCNKMEENLKVDINLLKQFNSLKREVGV